MASNADQAEYFGSSPASPPQSATSTGRTSFQSHGKTLSMASEPAHPTRSNRFSIQFPVQPTAGLYSPLASASPTRESGLPAPNIEDPAHPSDGNFLQLIAAQERRVLEIKEELQRAEADLDRLKRDWAKHEVGKKRDDLKRLTRLQTLPTSPTTSTDKDDEDGSSAWLQQEMERRKALLSGSKTSNRTVFPGQRHTRALSLLSPAGGRARHSSTMSQPIIQPPSRPPRKDSLSNVARQGAAQDPTSPPLIRAPVTPQADPGGHEAKLAADRVIDQEMLLRAGKKVASDFKDGLWTFWEDLRQATVGEESGTIQPPSRQSSSQTLSAMNRHGSSNSLKGSSRSSSTLGKSQDRGEKKSSPARKQSGPLPDLANPSFWSDHGIIIEPKESTASRKQTASRQVKQLAESTKRSSKASDDDSWETWDSPEQSRSSSSAASEAMTMPSSVSASGSPRTSGSSSNRQSRDLSTKKEAIPWPTLKKSPMGSLRRTASHLLSEWEKSLTPSPGEEFTGHEDYLGVAATAAEANAYGVKSSKKD